MHSILLKTTGNGMFYFVSFFLGVQKTLLQLQIKFGHILQVQYTK